MDWRKIGKVAFAAYLFAAPLAPATGQTGDPSSEVPAGPFLIFFEWDGRTISRDGRAILDEVLKAYRENGGVAVQLIGHSDRSGPANVNLAISRRRAMVVKDMLVKEGVPEELIHVDAAGETRLLIHTEDGVREAQNRRVEVHFKPR
ncbi:OmpA family protein [Sphingomicrobium lutaoense]|uniref:Outer membrane protein OmpA-like peptidoglycan-associated protein n=1 Tax=Sphingomicrobium lutaoense TaxID=515949 RepID=A0A839YWB2_9SPHN|nr:OmpA family protein [Sphingomicrobium lutaoense]MBB3763316.1 outer membrane protein OmpA-like peptidoglycan-associated protein [Sphingomicrobium lutaoense]